MAERPKLKLINISLRMAQDFKFRENSTYLELFKVTSPSEAQSVYLIFICFIVQEKESNYHFFSKQEYLYLLLDRWALYLPLEGSLRLELYLNVNYTT